MSRKFIMAWQVSLAILLLVLLQTAYAVQDILHQANQLMNNGQHQQAYDLLDQHVPEYAGHHQYDYLLGVAALRTGRLGEAMFALERVVAIFPGHAAARMELVSAYLQLGMNQQAQDQLAILETQSPPPAARASMDRFQEILRPRLSGTPDPIRTIGFSVGNDSNPGSYPDMELYLPGLLRTEIKPISSHYHQLRGILWKPIAINTDDRIDITLLGQSRQYAHSDAEQFNLDIIHLASLYNYHIDAEKKFGLGFQLNRIWLDNEVFRNHIGASARIEKRLDVDARGDLGFEWLDYRFSRRINDYQQLNVHGRVHKNITPSLRITGLFGLENENALHNRIGGDATRFRLQADTTYQISRQNIVNVLLAWSDTKYKNPYPTGLHNPTPETLWRRDNTTELTMRWRHLADRRLELNAELTLREQRSTIQFYDQDRWTTQFALSYKF